MRGPILVAFGAGLFACTNAASTAYYRRGGTIITVYLIRCIIVYAFNGAIALIAGNRATATNVVLLRTGHRDSSNFAYFRGALGSAQALGLNIALVFVTFADAFTIFKGVDSLSTVLIARTLLDSSERLSLPELLCGVLTLAGVVLIAQPPLLFGDAAAHTNGMALGIAALAGSLSAAFSVITRVLSKAGSAQLSPAHLLSHKLVVMFSWFAAVGLVGRLTGLAEQPSFHWMRFQLPADGTDWAILALHCALTLGAQLSLAAGYATTRAGIGGFLQLTELAWVYAIDVTILAEPTSLFASFGTILVFASALLVLQVGSSTSGKAGQTSAAPATKEMGPSSSLRESLLPPGAQKA